MAIVWGPTIRGWNIGIDYVVTSETASAITIRADYYFYGASGYNINDSSNTFSASGAFGSISGSRSVYLTSSGGTISLGSQSKTFTKAYGSTSSVSQSISLSGLEAVGATLTASASYTIPARTYAVPPAPTILTKSRTTQTSAQATWRNNHSTDPSSATYAPEIRVQVYALKLDGTWEHIKTESVAGSYTAIDVTGLTANRAYTLGIYAVNGESGESDKAWTGAIYPVPVAPTNCTSTRNSDARNTVSWSSTAPRYQGTSHLIERSTSGGTWTQIASVPASTTSYVDNTTTANNHYRYRVRTQFGDKYSGYAISDYTYNTPAAPSNVRAAKNADNSVTVSWLDNARTESGHSLQRSQDGGATWVTVTSDIAANATSYIDLAAPGGSLTYRVEAHRHPLYSGWSAPSPSITTIAPPKAPTITDYPRATVSTEDGGFTIGWLHNPVDGSAQTMAQVEIIDPSGTPSWIDLAGDTKTYTIDNISTGTYKVRVSTKGAHADWSPASPQVTITVAMPPQVIITAPATDGEVITALPYTTSWTYDGAGYDPVRVDYYIQRQEEDGSWTTAYLDQTVAGSGSVTLDADTVIPRNGETYRLHMWARAASGLTTMADRVFTTDYVEPAQPVVAVEYDLDKLSASVSVEDGTPIGDEVMPVSYTVLRITDEDEVVLADHAMSGVTVTDPIPPLNVPYTYRIISHAASGAISEQDVAAYMNSPSTFAINYGNGMTEIQVLRWNVSYDTDGSKEQQHQAYEGRKFPVLYSGRRRDEKHSISATILSEEVLAWSALDDWAGVCVLRTNCGKRVPVSESHSIGRAYNNVPSISVKMERVDYELG